jgi:lipid-A-disaccharide synthase-like uncharacterized protein
MNYIQILGTIGSSIVLLGFLKLEYKKWSSESKAYLYSNVLGSLLLMIYALILKSYPFVVLNTIWVVVSVKKIIDLKKNIK